MQIKRLIKAVPIAGLAVSMMAASAYAGSITTYNSPIIYYTTNAQGGTPTEFVAGVNSLTLDASSFSGTATAATLTFVPNTGSGTGTPSNIDLGDFLLTCTGCSTSSGTPQATATFSAFTFDLVVSECTTSACTNTAATGEFVGTSSGGTVYSDTSPISVSWSTTPNSDLDLGPGTNNALNGNFGPVSFDITGVTLIVGPNSGTPPGDTTVQAQIQSSTPEPGTTFLLGGGLLALGFLSRRKLSRS
jgi:hypothetical protein